VNIHVDDAIFQLQHQGGISRLWRSLALELVKALPEASWDEQRPPDLYISTYYRRAPLGVPSLAVVYDFIAERYPGIGAHHVDAVAKRQVIAEADEVVAISQWVADDCRAFCGKPAAVAYCGGGEVFRRALPDEVDGFQRRYGIERPYILMVGSRGLYKNGRSLYQAWQRFAGAGTHHLVCVGGQDAAEDAAFDRKYPGVRIPLTLRDADLAAAYSGATALVYPSLYEGFGLPLLEAMACGCPVICGDFGSLREVGGDVPFYCHPLLPLSLASAMNAALDPSERLQYVLRGFEQARRFTWTGMAARVAEVIRRMM